MKQADINGIKIRVMQSKFHSSIWKTLGANPTPMAWPIYTGLEQKVIDGQENPLWVIGVYKFYEIQKYMTLTRHVYSPHIDVVSLTWWENMDINIKKIVENCIYETNYFNEMITVPKMLKGYKC